MGERTVTAARRRLNEELGVRDPLKFGFFARYRADLDHGMRENELVYVYFGRLLSAPKPDPDEVAQVELASLWQIEQRVREQPRSFTYWMKHYLRNHRAQIARCAKEAAGR